MGALGESTRVPVGDRGDSAPAIEVLLDDGLGRRCFGDSVLFPTGSGFRFRARLGNGVIGERHRDQCLATFAELGMPLSAEVQLRSAKYHVRDLLNDSVAEFTLDEEDIEWTALAYALLLPPMRSWTNRYGEIYTFDDLANELLGRCFVSAPCCGVHLVRALTALYSVNKVRPVLSLACEAKVKSRIERVLATVLSNQGPDGSWPAYWYHGLEDAAACVNSSPEDSADGRLLSTGHLAEWLLYMPREFAVPATSLARAGDWLQNRLHKATSKMRFDDFCPYSHALHVVRELAAEATEHKGGAME
jgi:hypothetical protein